MSENAVSVLAHLIAGVISTSFVVSSVVTSWVKDLPSGVLQTEGSFSGLDCLLLRIVHMCDLGCCGTVYFWCVFFLGQEECCCSATYKYDACDDNIVRFENEGSFFIVTTMNQERCVASIYRCNLYIFLLRLRLTIRDLAIILAPTTARPIATYLYKRVHC